MLDEMNMLLLLLLLLLSKLFTHGFYQKLMLFPGAACILFCGQFGRW